MAFKKGRKKTGGRGVGTKNKATSEFKQKIETFVLSNLQEYINTINEIENPVDKAKRYEKLLEFVLPKQKEITLDGDLEINAVNIEFKQTGIKPRHNENEFLDD
jgi:hypothetical protein